jgi:hypothetical protein
MIAAVRSGIDTGSTTGWARTTLAGQDHGVVLRVLDGVESAMIRGLVLKHLNQGRGDAFRK